MSVTYEEVDRMVEDIDNQYLLTLAIAKRVRKLRSGAPSLVEDVQNSRRLPFKAAMEEFARKKILYGLGEDNKE
jgi:DNA-directed RNA polymerase subunit K/omega